jgi:uncharacterized protein (TIGR02145 family)
MKSLKFIWIFSCSLICILIFGCKPEEIILHGEISGIVSDTLTSQPLQEIPVKLNPLNSTISTSIDGKYLFKSLVPGDYKIEVSKPPYAKVVRSVTVTSANISQVNLAMHKIQDILFSERYLDFGLDSTQQSFTITNTGTGELNYSIISSQDWITVNPNIGEITTEPQPINVTIDRTGLSEKKHVESIEIVSHIGQDLIRDTISIYLNGVMDQRDFTYYGIVKIGTQLWMQENLNIGFMKSVNNVSTDSSYNDRFFEKYCYENNLINCDIYGGFYQWAEMMQYNPPDTGLIGTTQGVCMDGWHLPTFKEWETLFYFLGGYMNFYLAGYFGVGDKLKESGSSHWIVPNSGATNESGFSALPGGGLATFSEFDSYHDRWSFWGLGSAGFWMSTTRNLGIQIFHSDDSHVADVKQWTLTIINTGDKPYAGSVRCIKDPPKNK